jgi:hypothetical protein
MQPKMPHAIALAMIALVCQTGCGSSPPPPPPPPPAIQTGLQHPAPSAQTGPRIVFDTSKIDKECRPEDLEKVRTLVVGDIERSSLLKGPGQPVVYAHYEPRKSFSLGNNSQLTSSQYSHELSIYVKNQDGQETFRESYTGTVNGAFSPHMFHDAPVPGTNYYASGVAMGGLRCDLIAADLQKKLRAKPLP